jgi:hypothetical protein
MMSEESQRQSERESEERSEECLLVFKKAGKKQLLWR